MKVRIKRKLNEALSYHDHLQDGGNTFYVIDDRGTTGFVIALLQWGEKREYGITFDKKTGRTIETVEKPIFKNLGYFHVTGINDTKGECYRSKETLMKPAYVSSKVEGKGPILYDLVLSYCKRKGYWFMPDIQAKISVSAKPIWKFYNTKRKQDLEILQFDRFDNPFITPEDPKDDCLSNVFHTETDGSEVDQDWLDSPFTKAYRMKSDNLIKHYEQYKVMRISDNRFPAGYLENNEELVWHNNDFMTPDEFKRTI